MLCASSCHVDTPNIDTAFCDDEFKSGGIKHIGVFSCDWVFDGDVTINGSTTAIGAITDVANWITGIQNGFISISPEGMGDKPVSEKTTEDAFACRPAIIGNEDHTINFISKLFDTDSFEHCQWWSTLKTNYRRYTLFWVDCDDNVYVKSTTGSPGFVFSLSGNSDLVIPQTSNEKMRFEFSPSFRYNGIVCPLEVPDFASVYTTEVLS